MVIIIELIVCLVKIKELVSYLINCNEFFFEPLRTSGCSPRPLSGSPRRYGRIPLMVIDVSSGQITPIKLDPVPVGYASPLL